MKKRFIIVLLVTTPERLPTVDPKMRKEVDTVTSQKDTLYVSSVEALVRLLSNNDNVIALEALVRLHQLVGVNANDIAEFLPLILETATSTLEEHRDLVRLLVAKVHYYTGNTKSALDEALLISDIQATLTRSASEFSDNLGIEIIDILMTQNRNSWSPTVPLIDSTKPASIVQEEPFSNTQLEAMCKSAAGMVLSCGPSLQSEKQAIGVALELGCFPIITRIISRQQDPKMLIRYMVSAVTRYPHKTSFRETIYQYAYEFLVRHPPFDFSTIVFCLTRNNQPEIIANLLVLLAVNDEMNPESASVATQLCFDLYENAMPRIIEEVLIAIKKSSYYKEGKRVTFDYSSRRKGKAGTTPEEGEETCASVVLEPTTDLPPVADEATFVSTEEYFNLSAEEKKKRLVEFHEQARVARLKYIYDKLTKFIIILRGKATVRLWFEYLIRLMKSDSCVLRLLRGCIRSSVSMTALIFANAIMHCGTTGDSFAREHSEWFAKCSNWSKFAYVASYGVIHMGNHGDGMAILGSFLPSKNMDDTPEACDRRERRKYEESGAMVALGLIFSQRSSKIKEYVMQIFKNASEPVLYHGCCISLGLVCLGSTDLELISRLWESVKYDCPIKAFGASIGFGLMCLGVPKHLDFTSAIEVLAQTQHEKIKLGVSFVVACVLAQVGENANEYIRQLLDDERGACRLAAAYAIGTAYVGTGNMDAVRILWELIIFEVDEHVKRAAIISLAFVLIRDKPQFYDIMTQLFNSHHPMVRCSSAFALGLVFAGTGHPDAYALVSLLFMDVDVRVRQAAYIAAAMIMMHLNELTAPNAKTVREQLTTIISNTKSIDQLVRFGAILGIGLIDAGGKNMGISYFTSDGSIRIQSIVGMLLFGISFFWYPLIGFVALAFTPLAVIACKDDFSIPMIKFVSDKPSALFKYACFNHQTRRVSRSRTGSKLSAHRKSRKSKRPISVVQIQEAKADNAPEVEMTDTPAPDPPTSNTNVAPLEEKPAQEGAPKATTTSDPPQSDNSEITTLFNPVRVIPHYLSSIKMEDPEQYTTIKPINSGGIVVVKKVGDAPETLFIDPLQVKIVSSKPRTFASRIAPQNNQSTGENKT